MCVPGYVGECSCVCVHAVVAVAMVDVGGRCTTVPAEEPASHQITSKIEKSRNTAISMPLSCMEVNT